MRTHNLKKQNERLREISHYFFENFVSQTLLGEVKMIYRFTTEKGVDMTARLVLRGCPYGNAGCLSAEIPMVEFFKVVNDTKHNPWLTDVYKLKHDLYFISRYNLDTFLFGYCGPGPIEVGLCLEGSAPEYNLGPRECRVVAANLFSQLAREKFE